MHNVHVNRLNIYRHAVQTQSEFADTLRSSSIRNQLDSPHFFNLQLGPSNSQQVLLFFSCHSFERKRKNLVQVKKKRNKQWLFANALSIRMSTTKMIYYCYWNNNINIEARLPFLSKQRQNCFGTVVHCILNYWRWRFKLRIEKTLLQCMLHYAIKILKCYLYIQENHICLFI